MKKGAAVGLGLATLGIILLVGKAKAAPPPEGYKCPYCSQTFDTYEELVAHVQSNHPEQRIPLEIEWVES
jgi:hypothetical protein